MSNNEIREILAKRKSQARRIQRREAAVEAVKDAIAWLSLMGICFMLSVVG